MKTGSLETVRAKLSRAHKHLDEVVGALSLLGHGQCRIVPEENTECQMLVQRIHIEPKPDAALLAAVGDCLFGMRSALDYLAWQLVINNGGQLTRHTMFPITSDPEKFTDAVKGRKRLSGVSNEAIRLIETLQPHDGTSHPLAKLDALHNKDKHQTLVLTTVVADNTSLQYYRRGELVLDMFLGDEELHDGDVFGGIGVPLHNPELIKMFPNIRRTISEVEVRGQASLFVAFDDTDADSLEEFEVGAVLSEILQFIKMSALPLFEPMFA